MDDGNSTAPGLPFPLPLPTEPAPPDPNAERCHLLGPTALVVQALMGVMVITSLVIKRQLEKRKRKWRVWLYDVGKQLVGQAVIHGLNILISSVVADAGDKNPCSLYFLNILIDTTVGIAILWLALRSYTNLFIKHYGPEGYTSGQYGQPPQWRFWLRQLQPYLLAIVTMKLVVLLPLTLPRISALLIRFGQEILSFLSVDVQIIFVLAIFPLIMNVFQFCVVDQVIKAGKHAEAKTEHHDSDYDAEEDVESDGGYRPVPTREADIEAYGLPSPRRRGSSLRGSKPPSRAGSFIGSSPNSPLFQPEDSRLLNADYESRAIKSPTSARFTLGGENVWTAVARQRDEGAAVESTSTSTGAGTERGRRSDAPSPEADDPFEETDEPRALEPVGGGQPPFSAVSRLSTEAQRDARRELSPPRQKRRGREDGIGLHAI